MRILSILLLFANVTFAQEGKIALRTLALKPGDFPALHVREKSDYKLLRFSSFQPSTPVEADRSVPFFLFPEIPEEGQEKSAPPPIRIPLPSSDRILLLGWIAKDKPGFLAIPDHSSKGKFSDWAMINATSKDIAIQLGKNPKPVLFKAAANGTISLNAAAGDGVPVSMAAQQDGEWRAFYSTYWPVYEDQRGLVIAAEQEGEITVNVIFDQIAKEKNP